MKRKKKKTAQATDVLQIIINPIQDKIARFGLESMEVAEAFLEIAGAIFEISCDKDSNTFMQVVMPTNRGHVVASPIIMDRYIFGDPSLAEERLTQIETAFVYAIPTWSQTNPKDADSAVHTLIALARHYGEIAGPAQWEAMSKRVLNLCRTHLGQNHRSFVMVLADMGSRYAALGRLEEGDACLEEALTICESDPDVRTAVAPRILSTLTGIAIRRGDFVSARMFIDQATEILEQAPKTDKLPLLATLIDSAHLLQQIGDIEGFAQVSRKAQMVAEEVWESHPRAATDFIVIVIGLHKVLGRLDDAGRLIRWLAGKIRELARETGIDVLDRLTEKIRPSYGSQGLPSDLKEILDQIKAERDCPTGP